MKRIDAKKHGYVPSAFKSAETINNSKWKYIYSLDSNKSKALEIYLNKVEEMINFLQEKLYDIEFEYFKDNYLFLYKNKKYTDRHAYNMFRDSLFRYVERPLSRHWSLVQKFFYIYNQEKSKEIT